MDSHSISFILKIAASASATLAVIFVMYVKYGQMSLKKVPVKHAEGSDTFKK